MHQRNSKENLAMHKAMQDMRKEGIEIISVRRFNLMLRPSEISGKLLNGKVIF